MYSGPLLRAKAQALGLGPSGRAIGFTAATSRTPGAGVGWMVVEQLFARVSVILHLHLPNDVVGRFHPGQESCGHVIVLDGPAPVDDLRRTPLHLFGVSHFSPLATTRIPFAHHSLGAAASLGGRAAWAVSRR